MNEYDKEYIQNQIDSNLKKMAIDKQQDIYLYEYVVERVINNSEFIQENIVISHVTNVEEIRVKKLDIVCALAIEYYYITPIVKLFRYYDENDNADANTDDSEEYCEKYREEYRRVLVGRVNDERIESYVMHTYTSKQHYDKGRYIPMYWFAASCHDMLFRDISRGYRITDKRDGINHIHSYILENDIRTKLEERFC
jgi:hypothetical protein